MVIEHTLATEEREDSPLPSPNPPSTQSGVPDVQDETLTVKLTCDSETTHKEVEKEAKTSGMVNIMLFLMRYYFYQWCVCGREE